MPTSILYNRTELKLILVVFRLQIDVFNIKGSCTFSTNNTLDKITLCIENEKKILDKFLLLTDKANTTLKTLVNLPSEMASYLIREDEIDAKPTIYPVRLDCLLPILKPYKKRFE